MSQIQRICYRGFTTEVKKRESKRQVQRYILSKWHIIKKTTTDRLSLDKIPAQEKADETIDLRPQVCSFNKYLCNICQEHGGFLHAVEIIATGQ